MPPQARARDVSSIKRALVSGAAFPPSLQAEIKARGIDAYQAFGTADLGLIAFETEAREGMVVNEDLIMEIVKPGTGDPVAPGDVGEIVVTSLDPHHPWIRLALGDLTAVLPGPSPCGRTNMRIKGWMGRADQTTKVKGMFVRPEQVAEIGKRHPALGRLRLVVMRQGEADAMTLRGGNCGRERGAARGDRGDLARGDETRRQRRTGQPGRAAERRQGDRGRAVGLTLRDQLLMAGVLRRVAQPNSFPAVRVGVAVVAGREHHSHSPVGKSPRPLSRSPRTCCDPVRAARHPRRS